VKFSIIHPTARVTREFASPWWIAAGCAWTGCDNPAEVEYILVVHHSRMGPVLEGGTFGFGRFTVVTNYGRDCLVDQCNAGQLAASGEIVIGNQDDMRFPEHWDTEILKLLPDTSIPMCVQARTDGSRKDLLTIPTIATRVLVEQIGLMSTDYESMFSDDEWSIKAHKFAGIVPSTLYFQHLHPVNKTAESDAVYDLENRQEAYNVGWETFQKRKTLGFPRVPYPGENPATVPVMAPAQYPILAMCIPGEQFSGQWFDSFMAMGSELKEAGYIPKRFRGHTSNVYQTRISLVERVIEDAKITGENPKYVLWIDDDNLPAPGKLTGLLRFLDHYQQIDAVGGWCYIRKGAQWTTSAGIFWEGDGVHLAAFNLDAMFEGETPAEKFAPKKIEHTGFPFLLMRYDAMEKLGPHAFRPLTKADLPAYFDGMEEYHCPACRGTGLIDHPDYSEPLVQGGLRPIMTCPTCEGTGGRQAVADWWFCGEDSAWCLQAKKAGMTLAVDPGCEVAHLKLQVLQPTITNLPADASPGMVEYAVKSNGNPVRAPREYQGVGM